MSFDDLAAFKEWWLSTRAINTPSDAKPDHYGTLLGVVLYRQEPYQVQLFIMPPNSRIEPHIHPNVDSYEVFVNGDIEFLVGEDCTPVYPKNLGDSIRIVPTEWHGGNFGERGGCFISVQKWLNGVPPTSVGDDWSDKDNNTKGTGSYIQAEEKIK